jgi:type I restriction enzyme M protein
MPNRRNPRSFWYEVVVYWDDVERILLVKRLAKKGKQEFVEITQDGVENLPEFETSYAEKPIILDKLSPPENLVSVLMAVANVMRSHGVNDEHLRYKETVKLLLARYCDGRQAQSLKTKELHLQVKPGKDNEFKKTGRQIVFDFCQTLLDCSDTILASCRFRTARKNVARDYSARSGASFL